VIVLGLKGDQHSGSHVSVDALRMTESRSSAGASSFGERCYVLFSPALLYCQNILRCTFNIARCTLHVHCYHALDQHGFSLPCTLSAFSIHHPLPVSMHKLSMTTRCHACTQHFPLTNILLLPCTSSTWQLALNSPCVHSAFFNPH
jgi:hypothetical protein